jgi:membrane protein YqaA with SNARE-associated domain
MLAVIVTTVLYGAASAFVPALPAEPYLVGLVATTDYAPVPLGIAAGIGQSAGKVAIFLAARGTIRSPWLRRRVARFLGRPELVDATTGAGGTAVAQPVDPPGRIRRAAIATRDALHRWTPPSLQRLGSAAGRVAKVCSVRLARALDRPVVATVTVFVSAVVGLPPLVATTVYAGVTRMPVTVFGVVCVIGRSIRFAAIALVPTLIL